MQTKQEEMGLTLYRLDLACVYHSTIPAGGREDSLTSMGYRWTNEKPPYFKPPIPTDFQFTTALPAHLFSPQKKKKASPLFIRFTYGFAVASLSQIAILFIPE